MEIPNLCDFIPPKDFQFLESPVSRLIEGVMLSALNLTRGTHWVHMC